MCDPGAVGRSGLSLENYSDQQLDPSQGPSLPRKTIVTATVVGGLFAVIMLVGGIIAFHYKNPALGSFGTGLSPMPIIFSAISLIEEKSALEEKMKKLTDSYQNVNECCH